MTHSLVFAITVLFIFWPCVSFLPAQAVVKPGDFQDELREWKALEEHLDNKSSSESARKTVEKLLEDGKVVDNTFGGIARGYVQSKNPRDGTLDTVVFFMIKRGLIEKNDPTLQLLAGGMTAEQFRLFVCFMLSATLVHEASHAANDVGSPNNPDDLVCWEARAYAGEAQFLDQLLGNHPDLEAGPVRDAVQKQQDEASRRALENLIQWTF